ncbi:MAG TPA: CehA/McbA family metallohydrolase [Trueperaceae bacterium]|nr:CehA/McbA family metallohydrolase [Trueperaceae bacterium]
MERLPFDRPGHFYRGNVHTHTNSSDGLLPPAEVVARYREAGYDFVALTDHLLARYGWQQTDATHLSDDAFTVVRGAELHGPGLTGPGLTGPGEGLWHVVAVGLPEGFSPNSDGETGQELARRAVAAGAWVGAAHPAWYGATAADIASLGPIHAVEVYNAACAELNDRGDSFAVYQDLLAANVRLDLFVSDDTHFNGHDDSFKAWVMVKSATRAADDLVASLKAGNYYSSTGPRILDVARSGSRLTVRCTPVDRVYLTGVGARAKRVAGVALSEVDLEVANVVGTMVRVTIVDRGGARAWTNPFLIE